MLLPACMLKEEIMKHTNQNSSVIPEKLTLSPFVFEQIRQTIGSMPAEQGGILGGERKPGRVEVTHFSFDEAASNRSGVAYTPNNAFLNRVIKQEWRPRGVEYVGSIHSHPAFCTRPSAGDEIYAKRILETLELPYLLVPIVTTIADTGKFQLHQYAAVCDGNNIEVIEQELFVGGKPVATEVHNPLRIPEPVALPWEVLMVVGGAGLLTAGIATTLLVRALRHRQKLNEG